MAADWEHLLRLVSALERDGNAVVVPGSRPAQGGYECLMQDPLDVELVRPLVGPHDKDVHLAASSDMVWCSHCWASIYGHRDIAETEERQVPPLRFRGVHPLRRALAARVLRPAVRRR